MNESQRQHRVFKTLYTIARILLFPFFRVTCSGLENVPAGAAILCGNHSSLWDPIAMFFSLGKECHVHMIAKKELFCIPVVSDILKAIGTISVNRASKDTSTVRKSLKYLLHGEKIGIFPEGTRRKIAYDVEAKTGAVRLSVKTGAPLVPIYIPRSKKIFETVHTVIGNPIYYDRTVVYTTEDYEQFAYDLMLQIESLHPVTENSDANHNC